MIDFKLDDIKQLCEQALLEKPTGNDWLDSRYNEQVHYVGHTQPYYRAFYLIAQALKPALSVELGSWQGTAAAHLAVGNPQGKVITIDIHREDKAAQQRTIEVVQRCPNVSYINGWTIPGFAEPWTTVEQVRAYNIPIDILFIDAWHEYQYANKEKEWYFPLLADTALVICDDLADQGGAFPGMGRFWDEMNYEKFHTTSVHSGIPMGFIKYERQAVADNRTVDPISQLPDPRRVASKHRGISRKA